MNLEQSVPAQPDQPTVLEEGVLRFRANDIVAYLLEAGPVDMNELARLSFSREDRVQFAQLIGYSVSGWGDLPYVTDADWERVDARPPAAHEVYDEHA